MSCPSTATVYGATEDVLGASDFNLNPAQGWPPYSTSKIIPRNAAVGFCLLGGIVGAPIGFAIILTNGSSGSERERNN
jgi:hypothetical protein